MKKNDVVELKLQSYSEGSLIEDVEKTVIAGKGYLLPKLDDSILQHEVGDEYELEVSVDEAYGPRSRDYIKMIPGRYFKKDEVRPYKGLIVNVDGAVGKVISASPGRVMVDFNHPLAGKDLTFKVKLLKKVTKVTDQAIAVLKALLNQELKVSYKDGVLEVEDPGLPDKVRELLDKELKEVINDIRSIKYLSKQ